MPSWQARLLNGFLRLTMKRGANRPFDLQKIRATTQNPHKSVLAVPADYRVTPLRTDDGLEFDVARAAAADAAEPKTVVLYLHGGGYIFGSPKTHRPVLIAFSRALQAPVYGLAYRLAPEHPFPAAAEDAMRAYRWLLSRHPGSACVLGGDSAGAALALVAALDARDSGLKRPAAIVGFSPYVDLSLSGASIEANARSCAMFTPRGLRQAAAVYLGGAEARDPRASPLFADLAGLSPMLLYVSAHEALRDDTLRLAARARAAGVEVEVIMREHLPHVWPVFVQLLPEAREAFASLAAYARGHGL